MDRAPRCLYGLTVDGSRGPAYRMKSGGLVIARECGAPIYLVRTWFSRNLRTPTWDRTAIPLPFGTLQQYALGPYWVPPEADAEELEAIRLHLEHELLERSKRLLEDKLRALQVRDPHTHRSMHGHQGCPVPPQAEEADLRAKLDECAKQAPGEEALLMIGHLPPSRPRGQGVAELQEVPPSVDAVARPRRRGPRLFSTKFAFPAFRNIHRAAEQMRRLS